MPLPKVTTYSEDPEKRLNAVLRDIFGNSRLALARAAGVSRSLVNKWPPGSEILMDRHLLTAIDHELAVLDERRAVLIAAKSGIKDSIKRLNAMAKKSEADIRKELGQ
jgi:hypothetical protein